jgi:putative ABC transport system permease protein
VAAMRDDLVAPPSSVRRRGALGLAVFAAGAGLLVWGVSGSVSWTAAGFGAALVLVGALLAAPLATRPVVRVIVWPFRRLGGVVGRLAGQNALRVPRRTANTASALMIGLTLVAGLAVLASSIKASFSDIISSQLTSDYVLSAGNDTPVPAQLEHSAAALPGVRSVAALGSLTVSVAGSTQAAVVATSAALTDNVRLDVRSGSAGAIDRGQVLVDETTAKAKGWHVGSTVTATVGTRTGARLTVGGVFKDNTLLGTPFVVGPQLYAGAVPAAEQQDFILLIKAVPGTDLAALRASLTGLAKPYLVVSVQTGAEYVDSASAQVDQLVNLLYVLLALAIVIAVLGIINTLALSVVERTREIGLLRAVGLARRQLAGMITIESVATAVFGAVLGAALGIGLGTAFQRTLRGDGVDILAVPWGTIGGVLVAAAAVGVVAAVLPAIRAVRLNVLQAIATD